MTQKELKRIHKEVVTSAVKKQHIESDMMLDNLGVTVPWKDTRFVNWKTNNEHLGMDFISYLANASYNDMVNIYNAVRSIAKTKNNYDEADWDDEFVDLYEEDEDDTEDDIYYGSAEDWSKGLTNEDLGIY